MTVALLAGSAQQAIMRWLESPEVTGTQGFEGRLIKKGLIMIRLSRRHCDLTESSTYYSCCQIYKREKYVLIIIRVASFYSQNNGS